MDLSVMSRTEIEEYAAKITAEKEALEMENQWLLEQFRLSRAARYGRSSEQNMLEPQEQLSLFFNEVESCENQEEAEPELPVVSKKKKAKGTKEAKIKHLAVKQLEYRLTAEERICPKCGQELEEMKKEIRNEVTVVPAKFYVTRHVRYIYACRNCDRNGMEGTIKRAEAPEPILNHSIASPSLIAHVIAQKYVYAMPLYRQAQQLARYGLAVSRQTLANWVVRVTQGHLFQLYDAMKKQLVKEPILHADETEVEVLKEPGRSAQTKSYMWVYRSGKYARPCVIYEYTPSRGGEYPKKFLKEFSGYLQTDGYAGYHSLTMEENRPAGKVIGVGCFAHARRKYTDALKAAGELASPHIKQGIAFCDALFKIERQCEDMGAEKRQQYRQEQAVPILDEYFAWVHELEEQVLPKSKLAQALRYSSNQEQPLRRYVEDGHLELSNNIAERAIKSFVIGRKNWLFSNTPKGARTSAMLYSIAETAKENGLEPYAYLTYVLEQLCMNQVGQRQPIEELLPWSESLPQKCLIQGTETSTIDKGPKKNPRD